MQLAKLVGLDRLSVTRAGNAYVRSINRDESKRVSLAQVLTTYPKSVIRYLGLRGDITRLTFCRRILRVDKPTSGLDSSATEGIVYCESSLRSRGIRAWSSETIWRLLYQSLVSTRDGSSLEER